MQEVIDVSWGYVLLFGITLLIPFSINYSYRLGLNKDMCIGLFRMVVQLVLVGLYLEYLFNLQSLAVNIAWLIMMIVIGSSAILNKAKLPQTKLILPIILGLSAGLLPILALLCLVVIKPVPLYNTQYMIPLAGMLLGNSLSSMIIALQQLFSSFQDQKGYYEAAIALGAPPHYAAEPFVRTALQKSISPILASITVIGLVTLPGMMTGQILGGASPMIAVKYQLIIMISILVMMNISLTVSLKLALNAALKPNGFVAIKILNS